MFSHSCNQGFLRKKHFAAKSNNKYKKTPDILSFYIMFIFSNDSVIATLRAKSRGIKYQGKKPKLALWFRSVILATREAKSL
jgi:hypothetical protein